MTQGAERSRYVNQPDEIVTVLRNGMTVIAKRVPSPVLAVRGYVYAGVVYGEGLAILVGYLLLLVLQPFAGSMA